METQTNNNNKINTKVAFIVASTSRCRQWNTYEDSYLMSTLYRHLQAIPEDMSNIQIMVGMDDDDEFYKTHIETIKQAFSARSLNFTYYFYTNEAKSPCFVWNALARETLRMDNVDFIFQLGDDIILFDLKWIDELGDKIKNHDNKGLGFAIDANNTTIPTNAFVHKSHVQTLQYFFHPSIQNWFSDDWIFILYQQLQAVFKTDRAVLRNNGGSERYIVQHVDKTTLQTYVDEALSIFDSKCSQSVE